MESREHYYMIEVLLNDGTWERWDSIQYNNYAAANAVAHRLAVEDSLGGFHDFKAFRNVRMDVVLTSEVISTFSKE